MENLANAFLFFGFDIHNEDMAHQDVGYRLDHWDEEYKKRTGKDAVDSGCSVGFHHHAARPIWYVCSDRYVAFGRLRKLGQEIHNPGADAYEELQNFCKVMGFKWQEPEWCLASFYE